MTRLVGLATLVLAALVGGCGEARSGCELAQKKIDKCDAEIAKPIDPFGARRLPLQTTGECSGVNACVAPCVNATNCTTLSWALLDGQDDPNTATPADAGTFLGCLKKCMQL